MEVVIHKHIRKDLKQIWDSLVYYQHVLDCKVMQDLEIEGHCVLSGVFMTLFGTCVAMVLLMAISFALDEFDIECTAHASTDDGICHCAFNCHHGSMVVQDNL